MNVELCLFFCKQVINTFLQAKIKYCQECHLSCIFYSSILLLLQMAVGCFSPHCSLVSVDHRLLLSTTKCDDRDATHNKIYKKIPFLGKDVAIKFTENRVFSNLCNSTNVKMCVEKRPSKSQNARITATKFLIHVDYAINADPEGRLSCVTEWHLHYATSSHVVTRERTDHTEEICTESEC